MTGLDDAMAAAWAADLAWLHSPGREHGSWGAVPEAQLRRLLEAAAPLIAAAERERCAQLAEQRAAEISDAGVAAIFHMFAARLRRQQ